LEWDIVLKMFRVILILLSFISFSLSETTSESETLVPNITRLKPSVPTFLEKNREQLENFSLHYYHDKEQKLNIDTIQDIKFDKQTSNKFTFGYLTGDIWFKLTLRNQSQNSNFIFYLTESFFHEVNFFEAHQNSWTKQSSGLELFLKNSDRKNINPSFSFTIEPQSSKTFYIQFHTKPHTKGVSYGEFKIFTQQAFSYQNIFSDHLLYLFYFGTLFFILLFNLFLFIVLKDSIYIYYVGYIFFTAVYVLSYSGLIYPMGLAPWRDEFSISILLFAIFFTFFLTKLLNTKFYLPWIDRILHFSLITSIVSIPLILLYYDPWFNIITKGVTLLIPLLIYASIYLFIKGHISVKYYIVALVVYLLSMISLSLMTQGLIENSDMNHYAFIYGSYFEIIFFAFVLANRFYNIQNEIIMIKEQNEQILEAKVKNRTIKIRGLLKEKELLLREVYHRVKNNFQMVIGLLWIEASSNKNSEREQAFLELINRIKSMSLIHQYLLDSNTYSEIQSEEYLLKIIEETEQIYSKHNIRIDKEIDHCILEMNQAMALAVIVNEVLTNAVKHYHQQKKCHIYFSLKKQNSDIIMTIKDNGLGFLPNEHSNGFGLKMIKQFAKKLKYSHFEFSFDGGTKFVLSFKYVT